MCKGDARQKARLFFHHQYVSLHRFIIKLPGFVLSHPDPNQRTAYVVLTSQSGKDNLTGQILLRHLAFKFKTVTSMMSGHTHVLLAQQVYWLIHPVRVSNIMGSLQQVGIIHPALTEESGPGRHPGGDV